MTRYNLRITESAGQPATIIDGSDDLREAIKLADEWPGFIGGWVEVVDSTVDHPDHNVVHFAQRLK